MSNLGLKAAFKEDKFNLKMISVLFILVDLSLLGFIELQILFYLAIYEVSLILALMYGLRGQGKYKAYILSLQSVARNKKLTLDEREVKLVPLVHHICLELGLIYEERNKEYGLFKSNKKSSTVEQVPKKTKNKEVKKRMIWDEVVWKQFGYMIVGVWGFIGVLFLDLLVNLWDFSLLSIITIEGIWYVVDAFIFFYIHYIFKIEPVQEVDLLVNTDTARADKIYGGTALDETTT